MYCRNIYYCTTCCIIWLLNYSQFVAICELERAHHCWRQKDDLRTFWRQEKCSKCVIILERATNLCILYVLTMYLKSVLSYCTHYNLNNGENEVGPDSRHVPYVTLSVIKRLKIAINVDFRGERSQTTSPLVYFVYAFRNVDNCKRPLKDPMNELHAN